MRSASIWLDAQSTNRDPIAVVVANLLAMKVEDVVPTFVALRNRAQPSVIMSRSPGLLSMPGCPQPQASQRRSASVLTPRRGFASFACFFLRPVPAPSRGPPMPIMNRVADMHDEITAWRRDIHENPEILYEIHRTAGIVADKLQGLRLRRGRDRHRPHRRRRRDPGPQDRAAKVIGLRADMDALPMTEATGLPYASKTPGACTPAATTATRRCCSAPPSTSARRAISTARRSSSSSRPRKAAPAARRWSTTG